MWCIFRSILWMVWQLNSNSDFIAIISIILPVTEAHLMDLLYPVSDLQCCSHNILLHDHPWSCDATQILWTRILFTHHILSEASVVSTASFPNCWQNLNVCLWLPQFALLSDICHTSLMETEQFHSIYRVGMSRLQPTCPHVKVCACVLECFEATMLILLLEQYKNYSAMHI
jgi:hypothetical protein